MSKREAEKERGRERDRQTEEKKKGVERGNLKKRESDIGSLCV